MSRGRPKFTIRMDPSEIAHLQDVARAYGSPSAAEFAREMFEAILTEDVNHRLAFVHRLSVKLGEQLTLPLVASAERTERTARKPRKKRRGRDRTT